MFSLSSGSGYDGRVNGGNNIVCRIITVPVGFLSLGKKYMVWPFWLTARAVVPKCKAAENGLSGPAVAFIFVLFCFVSAMN